MIYTHAIPLTERVNTTLRVNTSHRQLNTGRALVNIMFNTTSLNDILDPRGDYAQGLMLSSGHEARVGGPTALPSSQRFATFVHFVTQASAGMLWGYHYDPNDGGLLVVEGFSKEQANDQGPAAYRTWQLSHTTEYSPEGGHRVDCVDVKYQGTPDALTDMDHEGGGASLWSPATKAAGLAKYIQGIVGVLIDPNRHLSDPSIANHFTDSVLHRVYDARSRK